MPELVAAGSRQIVFVSMGGCGALLSPWRGNVHGVQYGHYVSRRLLDNVSRRGNSSSRVVDLATMSELAATWAEDRNVQFDRDRSLDKRTCPTIDGCKMPGAIDYHCLLTHVTGVPSTRSSLCHTMFYLPRKPVEEVSMASVLFGEPAGESAPGAESSANPNLGEHLVLMCASALFTGLTPRDCREIAACARARTFARDELLFIQGQSVRSLILLQSGSVKHTQLSSDGKEVLMWMSGSGDAINLQAELPARSHTCSARAMEQCKALVWEYGRLQTLLAQYPQIRQNISRILADC
jgi:hypothetical protein